MSYQPKGPGPLPNRWLYCPRNGNGFIADRFLPFKTPLDARFRNKMPDTCQFEPHQVFSYAQMYKLKVGLWIDLTNTSRFYNRRDVEANGARYHKMSCRGHGETPTANQTQAFIELVKEFMLESAPSELIGVHCTHGFNRTGFLIVSYMVVEMDWSVEAALMEFARIRPPGIYKADYIEELFRRYEDVEDALPAPPMPDWCNDIPPSQQQQQQQQQQPQQQRQYSDTSPTSSQKSSPLSKSSTSASSSLSIATRKRPFVKSLEDRNGDNDEDDDNDASDDHNDDNADESSSAYDGNNSSSSANESTARNAAYNDDEVADDDEDAVIAPFAGGRPTKSSGGETSADVAAAAAGALPPPKKRRKQFMNPNATFMAGVEGVSLVTDQPRLDELQEQVQRLCGFEGRGFPGSQPVSMDLQNMLFLQQMPYRVSWKADGTRYMMLIRGETEVFFFDRDNSCFEVRGIRFPRRGGGGAATAATYLRDTVLDGEMVIDKVNGKSIPRYLVYDVVTFDGHNLAQRSFNTRLACIANDIVRPRHDAISCGWIRREEEPFSVRAKDFWDVTQARALLGPKFAQQLSHEPDGLIFQPVKMPYTCGPCDKVLKWKPAEMNSVDFRVKITVEDGIGIVRRKIACLYVGQHDEPFAQMKVSKTLRELDGKIVECKFEKNQWVFMRERTDKSFPNSYNTAMAVCKSIQYPVTTDILLNLIDTQRFGKDEETMPPPSRVPPHHNANQHHHQHHQHHQQQ